jgi:hypothetical protein
MSTVKFYVGEMSSYRIDDEEIHILESLDCVLTAEGHRAVSCLDGLLRDAQRDFIRSDNKARTLVALSVFEAAKP